MTQRLQALSDEELEAVLGGSGIVEALLDKIPHGHQITRNIAQLAGTTR